MWGGGREAQLEEGKQILNTQRIFKRSQPKKFVEDDRHQERSDRGREKLCQCSLTGLKRRFRQSHAVELTWAQRDSVLEKVWPEKDFLGT